MARLAEAPRSVTLEVRPAGERTRIPSGFEQTVPGTTVMFTLIVLLTSGAVGIVLERRTGLLRRLAASPLSRGEIVLGKWIGMMALGVIQVAYGVVAGTLLFGMDWGPAWPMVMLVLLSWASLVSALALLAGSFARSEGQAVALGVLSANVLAALGGCWWPIEVAPSWMQRLALFLPTGWAMDAIHRLAIFQHGAASALPHVLGLVAAALALGWGAARIFRYE
jgi:ABC-type multidrug transport system permease subunit